MPDVCYSLKDGHAAADAEDAHGDDQAPEEYNSMPWPNGWALSAGRAARRRPWKRSPPLPVSTREWMPSEIMAELPVIAPATNLMAAMAAFPAIAATTAVLVSAAMLEIVQAVRPGSLTRLPP